MSSVKDLKGIKISCLWGFELLPFLKYIVVGGLTNPPSCRDTLPILRKASDKRAQWGVSAGKVLFGVIRLVLVTSTVTGIPGKRSDCHSTFEYGRNCGVPGNPTTLVVGGSDAST